MNSMILEKADHESACGLAALVLAMLGKRVRVTFIDSMKRTAKLTHAIGHRVWINGKKHVTLDGFVLDNDHGEIVEIVMVERIDNLEVEIPG